MARPRVVGHRQAEVAAGRLDAATIAPGRVDQRAVPVEDEQVEPLRHGRLRPFSLREEALAVRRAAAPELDSPRRRADGRTRARAACRNMRFRPRCASARFSSKSPYLSSPTIGKPEVREVHADLVRAPGLELASTAGVKSPQRCGPAGTSVRDVAPALGRRSRGARRSAVTYLRSGSSTSLLPRRPAPRHQRQIALLHAAARGTRRAARSAPCASWPAAARPRSRGRAGAPVRGTCACGRAARSCSITPKLTPLPPCTATPAGLSMTSSASSSNRIGNPGSRPRGRPARRPARAVRTGGMRIRSPACSR